MKMKQGDIVLVPFPYTDLTAIKSRPALIISKNNLSNDIILLGITSRKQSRTIEIDNPDLIQGSLPILSYVKKDKVATLDKSLARKVVARLNPSITTKIITEFKELF